MNDEHLERQLKSLQPRPVSQELARRIAATLDASDASESGPSARRTWVGLSPRTWAFAGGGLAAAAAIVLAWAIGLPGGPAGPGPAPDPSTTASTGTHTDDGENARDLADLARDGGGQAMPDLADAGSDSPAYPMRLDREALKGLAPTDINYATVAALQPEDLDYFLKVKTDQMLASFQRQPTGFDPEPPFGGADEPLDPMF